MILILIFAEALGLYGLIIAIILTQWGMLVTGTMTVLTRMKIDKSYIIQMTLK
jgi:hypothetical protein